MAWHVSMTWHNASGLILSLTLPGHYWITLTIHVFKLALGKGITAHLIAVPARRVLHGLYAVWWLAPALSRNHHGPIFSRPALIAAEPNLMGTIGTSDAL